MSTAKVAFVDTETISLVRDHAHLWEVALIVDGQEYSWFLDGVPLEEADPMALTIGHFYERYPRTGAMKRERVAECVAHLAAGRHLVGAVPSFDEERLNGLLRSYGFAPAWHYHLIDVEALAVGWLQGKVAAGDEMEGDVSALASPPWNSADLYRSVGVDPDDFGAHTALGDARLAKAVYEKVMGL